MILPEDWAPPAKMERIILHWTAGTDRASAVDRDHYHLLVEGDGAIVRGARSISDNVAPIRGRYAAHTLNCNTGSIGVALCGMAGAREQPFDAGQYPLTREQWGMGVSVLADLCLRYNIAVGPETVLTHAEVEHNLGIPQRGKWDIKRLPFDRSIVGAKAAGDELRAEVARVKAALAAEPDVGRTAVDALKRGVTTPDWLNFRLAPNGEVIGRLPEGTDVVIVVVDGDWLQVRTPASYVGWVHGGYVEAA